MMTADRGIRWSTALAVLGVAAVAAVASYEHAYDLERAHGESGWTARMVPLTVDGLVYASSMVMLDSAGHPRRRWYGPTSGCRGGYAGRRRRAARRAGPGDEAAAMAAGRSDWVGRTGVSSQHTTDEAAAASGRASGSWSTA